MSGDSSLGGASNNEGHNRNHNSGSIHSTRGGNVLQIVPHRQFVDSAPVINVDSNVDMSRPRITEAVKKGIFPFMKFAFNTSEITAKSDFFYAFYDHFDIGQYHDQNAKLAEQVRLWTDKDTNLQKKAYNALKELRHNAKHGVKTVMTSK